MKTRYQFFDFCRGIAIMGMVIYHFFFILNFYGLAEYSMRQGMWLVMARTVQILFIGIVGVMLGFTWQNNPKQGHASYLKRRWRRAATVLVAAGIVSLATYYGLPDGNYVRFGILHLIGTSMILASILAPYKIASLCTGIVIIALTPTIHAMQGSNYFDYALGLTGFPMANSAAIDYFQIFPWLGLVLIGVWLGNLIAGRKDLLEKINQPLSHGSVSWVNYLGRHSLVIYLIQIPVIMVVLMMLGLLSPTVLF